MTAPDFTNATWATSSYSGSNGGDCVEVARSADATAVGLRDSKRRGDGIVAVCPLAWHALLAAARAH